MRKMQLSWAPWLLLVLSLIGAGISIYLTSVHYENVPLLCSTSGLIDCSRVLSSTYSVVPGTTVPISVPGLLWCIVSASLAIAGLHVIILVMFLTTIVQLQTPEDEAEADIEEALPRKAGSRS